MKKQFSSTIALLLWVVSLSSVFAQSTEIRPGITLPQMTTVMRTALVNPANGSLIFDTNTQSYWYRQTGMWVEIKGGANYWALSGLAGNEIANTNSGGFWSKNSVALTLSSNNSTNPPTVPINEAGTRLMWIPGRSAFRVGTITDASKWSASNVGLFSFASGINTFASGYASTAMGYAANVTGNYSTALGNTTIASGESATAIGYHTEASGIFATAIGIGTSASGQFSTAMGNTTTASGHYSTALGVKVNTNNKAGTFMIGDSDPDEGGITFGDTTNQFFARFYNGYYLLTSSGANSRTGVQIGHGQTAWSSISDSTRKEKFVAANGESFLLKLRGLRLGSWNYKHQGAKAERFYGPMAQEIYAAFGKDAYGTIGNDTTVSTINMDGLLFIFSQALEKRTQDLQTENQQLKALIQKLDARLESLEANLSTSAKSVTTLNK